MEQRRRALVSGAGIAGPTFAWWLARYGWDCTVVERAPELRTGGQNVDVRGAGREVLRRMDLDDAVGARGTGEVGTRFVDEDGRTVAAFPAGTGDTDGATAEREILRGQLAELLFDETSGSVAYRFDNMVVGLDDQPDDGCRVTFADGEVETYDVVVLAEGIGSRTRDLVEPGFGVERRDLGVSVAYFSVDRRPDDDDWWRWYNAPGGRSVTLRPDNVGRQRATLSFRSPPVTDGLDSPAAQRALLAERFANAGWEVDRLVDGLDDGDDLYLDDLGQIRAERWSSGRVVLLGDAAYCASPVSGMGTTLAIVGAYVLAGELAAHVHHRDAFAGYERVLRPYVDVAQQLPPGAPGIMHPRSRAGVAVLRAAFRAAASGPLRRFEQMLFRPPADRFTLPDYGHLIMTGRQ